MQASPPAKQSEAAEGVAGGADPYPCKSLKSSLEDSTDKKIREIKKNINYISVTVVIIMNWFKFWCVTDNPPKNPGCFVVLSYTVNKNEPTHQTKSVIKLAFKWWKKFPKAKVIMSTGENQKLEVTNAKVMAGYGIKIGIPKSQIIEEDKSMTTYENLIFSRKIIDKHNFKNITLVTFDLHTRRALAIAKKLGWKNFYWLSVYSKSQQGHSRELQTHSRLTIFVYEVLAFVYNKIRKEI